MMAEQAQSAGELRNSEFLAALARGAPNGSSLWVCGFGGNPHLTEASNWAGRPYDGSMASMVDAWGDRNTYFSTAALTRTAAGELRRRNTNFARLLALVVDDVILDDIHGRVSWVIETSPGKFQAGILIDSTDRDAARAAIVDTLLAEFGVRGLRLLGARVDYLVPNRLEHGYGLTPDIVNLAAARQPDLLVTVDNGIAAVEGVAAANALGIPVLVTDHHLPGEALPDAACIVNPNQPNCGFGSKNLAGVGVMFYVLLALRAELRQGGAYANAPEPDLRALLDLVALGTVADVVKLDANNRTLVAQGLARMRAGHASAGVNALFRAAGRDPARATVFDLGFMLGPRLNAAGRLDDMALGIECLLADDPASAQQLAQQLDTLNRAGRDVEAGMLEGALAILATFNPTDSHSLTAFQPGWHIGIIGILASRLKDKFHRPTIVLASCHNGELKGSGRSIPGLHLRDALDLIDKRHPGLITKFGGHAMAAGLSIPQGRHEEFSRAFEAVVRELIDPADLEGVIETDVV